jgi:heme/copper-type cytochrome/quinol oxidase subunit 2
MARVALSLSAPLPWAGRRWLAAAITGLLAVIVPLPTSAAGQERVLTVDAAQFEFRPGTLRVNQGDTVVLRLEAQDVVHGLYVDGYGVSTQAEPGRPGELRFVADQAGAFHIRCAVPCGVLHPFMIGKLVVGPNLLWLRAMLATALTTIGALFVFWRA